jgi:pyruvate kinase
VVRMNFSHGTAEQHAERVTRVREIAASLGREVGILADLQGPKIRIEKFAKDKVHLVNGSEFRLVCRADAPLGDETQVGVSYLGLVNDVAPGDTLLLDDGLVALMVKALDALSEQDKEHIAIAAKLDVDFLAVSFCRSAADIELARSIALSHGSYAHIVAKIERAEAIERLVEITQASDVVMVARGDLGVEIGDAELPGLQKLIIKTALECNKVVITATQMLQSMVDNPIPTRAEVLDVANSVIDGTDAVMLSAETASGAYPVKAVEAMNRICLGAERQFKHDTDFEAAPRDLERVDQAIAMSAMFIAEHIQLRGIIALTESGGTARYLSRFRANVPLFGLSRFGYARRRMALMRDVAPVNFDSEGQSMRVAARKAIKQLFDQGYLVAGDRVLITSGDHMEQHGATNTLRLLAVGEGGRTEGLGDL